MANIWLVPVEWDGFSAMLRQERLPLHPPEHRERFLTSMQRVHSRLLLLFKAAMLLDDEAAEACGVGKLPFSLGHEESIRLVVARGLSKAPTEEIPAWPLSHCGEAYLNRLLTPAETAELLASARVEPEALSWLQAMEGWLRQGLQVILLREDGSP
jgi:hypothetical protein